jgi:hypothetical protein
MFDDLFLFFFFVGLIDLLFLLGRVFSCDFRGMSCVCCHPTFGKQVGATRWTCAGGVPVGGCGKEGKGLVGFFMSNCLLEIANVIHFFFYFFNFHRFTFFVFFHRGEYNNERLTI